MREGWELLGFMGFCLLLGILWYAGFSVGQDDSEREWQNKAIHHNAATWLISDTGEVRFAWIDCDGKVSGE